MILFPTHTELICIWSLLSAPLPDGHPQRRLPPQVVVLSPSFAYLLCPMITQHLVPPHTVYLSLSNKTVAWTLRSFPLSAIFFCLLTGWWKLGQETAGEVKATEQHEVRFSITSRSNSTVDQKVIWAVKDGAVNQESTTRIKPQYQQCTVCEWRKIWTDCTQIFMQAPHTGDWKLCYVQTGTIQTSKRLR